MSSGWPTGGMIALALLAPVAGHATPTPQEEAVVKAVRSDSVVVSVEVRSETGDLLTAATVSAAPRTLTDSGPDGAPAGASNPERRAFVLVANRFVGSVLADSPYVLIAEAPGHETLERLVEPAANGLYMLLTLSLDPFVLPEIRASAPRLGTGTAGRSVRRIRFEDQALTYASLGDWLDLQLGVTVRGGGPGGRQMISLRGSRPEGVLVLLDGAPVNDPMTGRADLSFIPPATLETATLIKGTASARFGSGAGAGVLLLTSKAPRKGSGGIGLRFSSFGGVSADGHVSLSGRRGRLSVAVAMARAENDFSFRNRMLPGAPVERRDNADMRSVSAAVSGTSGDLHASLRVDGVERGVPGRMGTSVFDEARWSDAGWTGSVGLGDARRSATLAVRARRLTYAAGPAIGESTDRTTEWRLGGGAGVGAELGLSVAGRLSHESVSGDNLDGALPRTVAGLAVGRPTTIGGLTIEPLVAVDATSGATAVSPELALGYGPSASVHLWARAGRGFRLPTFADLYFASSYGVRPNPHLRPETFALDAELGAGGRTRSGAWETSVSLAAYYRRTEDPIVWLASTAAVWSPHNLELLRAWGLEADLTVSTPGGRQTGWRLRLGGSLDRSRLGFGRNRNPMPYQPGASAVLTAERWGASRSLRLDVTFTGARTTSVAKTRRLPAFTVLDLTLAQRLPLGALPLEVLLRIENLFGERYEVVELFPEPARRLELCLQTG